ncbi:GNAT family N-acetyltransferase [Actinomycetospora sp. CA-101289]|uniref:GNAT family N-acetyltransferase n=1 Tax=Actinomycetospora sp. CA-101289 TaxID=3239893 RepID=UPI003D96F0A1
MGNAIAGSALHLERCHPTDDDWRALDRLPGRELFSTRAWVEFLVDTQGGEPVVAKVVAGERTVGWFTGLVVRRLGLRILGSPFPGWTTPSMGFAFLESVDPRDAARALHRFAFRDLGCVHLEFSDRSLREDDLAGLGFRSTLAMTFQLKLGTDDDIFGAFTSSCRRAVRKAAKTGVVVEEATGPGFAEEYLEQLTGVFARQGLAPTYGVDRIRSLVDHLGPTGRLLLLRARDPDGTSIATGIYPADDATAYFFGGASVREKQILRPNEALFWHAMRHWRDRGVETFDFGGRGDYKRRYGGTEFWYPAFQRSRYPGLPALRGAAQWWTARRQQLPGGAREVASDGDEA